MGWDGGGAGQGGAARVLTRALRHFDEGQRQGSKLDIIAYNALSSESEPFSGSLRPLGAYQQSQHFGRLGSPENVCYSGYPADDRNYAPPGRGGGARFGSWPFSHRSSR